MATLFTTRIIRKVSEGKNAILDAGCGDGFQAVYLARIRPNSSIVGYDESAEAIEKANKLKERYEVPNAEFFVANHDNFEAPCMMDMIYTAESLIGEDEVSYKIIEPLIESEPIVRSRFSRFREMLLPGGIYILTYGSTDSANEIIIGLAKESGLSHLDTVQGKYLEHIPYDGGKFEMGLIFQRG